MIRRHIEFQNLKKFTQPFQVNTCAERMHSGWHCCFKTVSTKPCTDDDLDGATLPTATVVSGGDAANLEDFISANIDLSISEKDGLKFLTCNICAAYLSTPSCVREKTQGERLPTGSTNGSLCHGLYLKDADYISYTSGKNMKWYRFKKTLVDHIAGKMSKTHRDAVQHHHLQKPL